MDPITGQAAAGQHPPALAELEKERTWLLAAQRYPRPQLGSLARVLRGKYRAVTPLLAMEARGPHSQPSDEHARL